LRQREVERRADRAIRKREAQAAAKVSARTGIGRWATTWKSFYEINLLRRLAAIIRK